MNEEGIEWRYTSGVKDSGGVALGVVDSTTYDCSGMLYMSSLLLGGVSRKWLRQLVDVVMYMVLGKAASAAVPSVPLFLMHGTVRGEGPLSSYAFPIKLPSTVKLAEARSCKSYDVVHFLEGLKLFLLALVILLHLYALALPYLDLILFTCSERGWRTIVGFHFPSAPVIPSHARLRKRIGCSLPGLN